MIEFALRGSAVALVLGAVATGIVAVREAPLETLDVAQPAASAPTTDHRFDPARLVQLTRRTTPFRVGGRVPAVRYGVPANTAQPAAPPPPRPPLVLTGILLGAEPAAILEGVPGVDGPLVVRPGGVIGPLTIASVDSERVVVRGLDTTWNLRVRQPWQ